MGIFLNQVVPVCKCRKPLLQQLQKDGVVRHIGLSSHTPAVSQRILNNADVDMLMFSVNPAYDFGQGEYANGSADERSAV